ncbi:unnamed protein product [Oppiella nova]|uniref:Major facilitator superfamily (MFS) profile domain-containing protein n=1 Tax=Oppiella nova TaxID=334625 RepID=A0A7R9LEL8_9ACAR|nr:unnamed protein product [Oppiella nova]CAG2162784.1 unnamed protein product [Oppiella nova]
MSDYKTSDDDKHGIASHERTGSLSAVPTGSAPAIPIRYMVAGLVVGGRLAEIFGAKWLCAGGIGMSILVNALTPMIARSLHYWLLLASRVVLGMFQAFIFPSCYALFSKWAPDHERSTFLSFPTIGGNIGTIATSSLSGYLSENGFDGGWPSVFYVSAMLAMVWMILWILLVKSEPKDHPWVSHHELHYIHSNIKSIKTGGQPVKRSVPWVKICTSKAVLSVFLVKFTMNWNYCPSMFASGFIADYLVRKEPRLEQGHGMLLFGVSAGGEIAVIADMTNNFTATVFAIGNTIAFTCGVITPLVIGYILEANDDTPRKQWGYVFYMSGAINICGGLVFAIFGSAKQQDWDKDPDSQHNDDNIITRI